jgi:ABC-type transporter Mla MlaB component
MTRDSVHLLKISGDAGLRAAQELSERLRQALGHHDRVAIATDAITAADITTIQLLLAARKQAQAAGKSLSLVASPVGVLRDLLIQVGCLDTGGQAPSPDDDFWNEPIRQGKGKAA